MKRLLPALFLLSFSAAVCAENELETQASNFFRDLKAASPNLSERLKQDPVLWDKMISAAIPGMIPAEKQKPTAPKEKAPLYPARLIAQNTIFYARLDRIDEQSLQKLMAEMRITARIANRPVGAILDLRSADNGDFDSVARFVALFTPQPEKKMHFFQKIPLAVLCGKKTNGPAELLTILLERSRLGISLGETGAGNSLPRKETVINGRKWLVPELPDFAKDVPLGKHTPMIECTAYPQIPFEQIGKMPTENDPAIRRATDLLRSLHAIRRK